MSQSDFRNAISINVPNCAVDGAGNIPDNHVALPGGIFEPDQFSHSAGDRDQIRLAVVIDVGDDNLVTTVQISGDCVLYKSGGRRFAVGGLRAKEIEWNKTGSNSHDQQSHTPSWCSAIRQR